MVRNSMGHKSIGHLGIIGYCRRVILLLRKVGQTINIIAFLIPYFNFKVHILPEKCTIMMDGSYMLDSLEFSKLNLAFISVLRVIHTHISVADQ